MRRVVAAALLSGALAAPLTIAGSAQAADRVCERHKGLRTCTTTTVTTEWSGDQGHEYGTGNDGALAALWCVQDWPGQPLVEYEAFATDYLVETTTTKTVVRRVKTGKVVSREVERSRTILEARTGGEGQGANITCTYGD
ncbi:hypothetical protein [Nocardioides caldifontis]|uniref:hypothetical protein n=1 Tax=Nocardioides caldifontis TaxID=2588938 RepID=UPI0011DF71E9|nr:hypothetical protein [Nocardioides caldifontis]